MMCFTEESVVTLCSGLGGAVMASAETVAALFAAHANASGVITRQAVDALVNGQHETRVRRCSFCTKSRACNLVCDVESTHNTGWLKHRTQHESRQRVVSVR